MTMRILPQGSAEKDTSVSVQKKYVSVRAAKNYMKFERSGNGD
jgi:hypothetical protein